MSGWNIHFWEPSVSPHKLALVRALQQHPAVSSCCYISQHGLSKGRREQGWELGSVKGLKIRLAPSAAEVDAIIASAPERSFHLFSGIHRVPVIVAGLRAAKRYGARFTILAEPRASEGVRGAARLAHSWSTEWAIRRQAAAVLAIGRNGPSWFRRTGFRPAQIFPFAYFLPRPSPVAYAPRVDQVRVSYLGRLEEAKGIRLFLEACALLPEGFAVTVAGAGPDAPLVEAAARSSDQVSFLGALPMSSVPAFLSRTDILAVPSLSTDDGWGAVVSEALLAGAIVVATCKVGASICLDEPWRGTVVSALTPKAIATAISNLGGSGLLSDGWRERRAHWASEHLTGEPGAAYLVKILAHLFDGAARPQPFYLASP